MKRLMHILVKELQFFLLLVLLFGFAMFQGGFVSWFLFYSMLPILLYLMMIPFYPVKNWKVTRNLSDRYLATGSEVEVTVTIERKFPFPIFFLLMEEIYPESLHYKHTGEKQYQYLSNDQPLQRRKGIKKVIHLGFRRSVQVHYILDHLPRGKHQLADTRITIGDAFGFIDLSSNFQDPQEFYVYPAVHPMKWSIRSHSMEEGNTSVQVTNDKLSNIVSGVREYVSGDRVSWIDWKTSAKKNTMITKEFEQEKDANITVLLDVSSTAPNQLVFDASIQWTISVLYLLRKNGQQVSFLTLGEKSRLFTNHHIYAQFAGVQNYLATVTPEETAWIDGLQKAPHTFVKGSVYLFVVHHLDEAIVQRLLRWRTQELVLICYIAPSELLDPATMNVIRALRKQQVSVQTITEEQLVQTDWEVTPTR